jgi:hypothetical protein
LDSFVDVIDDLTADVTIHTSARVAGGVDG